MGLGTSPHPGTVKGLGLRGSVAGREVNQLLDSEKRESTSSKKTKNKNPLVRAPTRPIGIVLWTLQLDLGSNLLKSLVSTLSYPPSRIVWGESLELGKRLFSPCHMVSVSVDAQGQEKKKIEKKKILIGGRVALIVNWDLSCMYVYTVRKAARMYEPLPMYSSS